MMSIDDEILKKKKLADFYFDNYKKHRDLKEYQKASEFLWGALNNLIYAFGLIFGERLTSHKKIKEFINRISTHYNKEEIAKLFSESAEVLHANFYHDFLDEDSFKIHARNVEKLLFELAELLIEELRKRKIGFS